ncbi:MAG: helix-turn-helix domain-containing protein [Clostridia bacterium]|nr:helix-turn-helix domain-containing protein [Clostridia bacterium]MDO4356190.1 helix-turn-helix domain-containing protein [Clostridia bacterium]
MADNKFSRSKSLMSSCVPMTTLQSIIGGKWKVLIIWYIACYKVQRFGELQRRIGDEITKSTLTRQLRELEQDGWIHRQVYQEIPPRVEYTLTELAESFVPILEAMREWSEIHLCGG